jgi:fermentation-respiration switch protein FrsA (DUF1100 family)
VLRLLIILVAVIVLLRLMINQVEPAMVFFPTRGLDDTPASLGLRYDTVTLSAADGVRLTAWQLEPENPIADIVYFHGNGGNLSIWLPVFATLHAYGYRVFAIDYRGYGTSAGSPSERGLELDAEAAVRHAASRRSPVRPLIFWGRSLGGAVAARATRAVTPDALVLESTFPDKAAVVRSMPLLRVLNTFATYRFDTVDALRNFQKPVLVVHGDRDSIVPFALGRELFDKLGGKKRFVAVPGADHNDFFDARHAEYWNPIRAFLGEL